MSESDRWTVLKNKVADLEAATCVSGMASLRSSHHAVGYHQTPNCPLSSRLPQAVAVQQAACHLSRHLEDNIPTFK